MDHFFRVSSSISSIPFEDDPSITSYHNRVNFRSTENALETRQRAIDLSNRLLPELFGPTIRLTFFSGPILPSGPGVLYLSSVLLSCCVN